MSLNVLEQNPTNQYLASNVNSDEGIYNSEVKSDTEEYFEYFEIDGQQYRRKMTKRTVVEKRKCQQTVFAPLKSDGSGPDLSNVAIMDSELHPEEKSIEAPEESHTETVSESEDKVEPFKRFTEDGFRISGSKFLRRSDDLKKLTMPCNLDSVVRKTPNLLTNYTYRCGQSDFEVPIIDTQFSTVLHKGINSEWFNTEEIDLPNQKSKSISYFKETYHQNEYGLMVYNRYEKTKSRTLRLRKNNNSIQSSQELETGENGKLAMTLVKTENKIRNGSSQYDSQCTGTQSSVSPFSDNCLRTIMDIDDLVSNNTMNSEVSTSPVTRTTDDKYSFILTENNPRPYLVFDDDAKHEECDIAGGPVDALIVHACDGKEHLMFLGAFLDTYRTFIKPEDLINRLIIRYKFCRSKVALVSDMGDHTMTGNGRDVRNSKSSSPEYDYEKKCIHVLSLLLTIIGKLKRDFTEGIERRLQLFEEYLRSVGEHQWVCTINNTIKTVQESMEKDDEQVQLLENLSSRSETDSNMKSSIKGRPEPPLVGKLTILDFSSREIAEQMTLLDWVKYRDVELIEVLNLKDIAKCKLPGVIEYAKHFQNVQYWVQTILLDPDKRAADRDKHCVKLYRIMKHLRQLNNFSSYIAILLAIQLLPTKKLFSKRIRTKIAENEEYMKPTRFLGYKEDLRHATAPCIPFLGLFYQDLVMLNIANPQYLDMEEISRASGDSNWSSNNNYQLLSSIIDQCGPVINFWRSFKQYLFLKNCNKDQDKIRYPIKPNEKILRFLNNFQFRYDEHTIQKLSKQL